MANIKKFHNLRNADKSILQLIYKFRGLTFEQICEQIFTEDETVHLSYCKQRISFLKKNDYINKVSYSKNSFYFLTTLGASYIKNMLNLGLVYDNSKKHTEKRTCFTANELFFKESIAEHQYHLNSFVLSFMNLNLPIEYNVFLDKEVCYISEDVKPDGIIETNDTLFFLEMDMGTERKIALNKKWSHYRNYLHTVQSFNKKIVVLFFIQCQNIEGRKKLCMSTCYNSLFDLISDSFNIYFGSTKSCLQILKDSIMTSLVDDNSIQNAFFTQNFYPIPSSYLKNYSCYQIPDQNGTLILNDILQEFFVYDLRHVSILGIIDILNLERVSHEFYVNARRLPRLLFILNSTEDLLNIIELFSVQLPEQVYFITYNNLISNLKIENTIFSVGINNSIYYYLDAALTIQKKDM